MAIALLATGNEITSGDVLNTNGHEMAHALNSEGLEPGLHLSCPDDEASIVQCLEFLSAHHSIIIIIGGLGPTSDDKTRFALSRFLTLPLVVFPEAMTHIEERCLAHKVSLNQGNRQQAYFPALAKLIPNPNGTAMGCFCQKDNALFILLPGPPKECLPMFSQQVLPYLQASQAPSKECLRWRLFGIAESEIGQILDGALQHLDCETGYRWDIPYIEFKVRCHPELRAQICELIEPLVSPYIIAPPEKKASQQLVEAIIAWQNSIAIIDEATGGVLQTLIQQPDSKPWLSFQENPGAILQCRLQGLDAFWNNQEKGSTTVTLIYQYDNKETRETHTIPYRNPSVVYYAAEWLSSRLFHFIEQLH